ncbi:MAG: hypothetical protein HOF44_11160 [Pelagibacterales bacterium]|jgi:hypothetical protein|nr:hypothetical protein [Pelagibacterales bacterium]MBT4109730.1 hypothetical protein [Pelagibacterales bacterium]
MALSKNNKYQLELEKELIRHKCILLLVDQTKKFYLTIFGFFLLILLDLILLVIIGMNIELIYDSIISRGKYIISLIEFKFSTIFVLIFEIIIQFWFLFVAILVFTFLFAINTQTYQSLIKTRDNAKTLLGIYFNQGFLRRLIGGNMFFEGKKALKVNSKDIFIEWTNEYDKPFKKMLENSLKKVFLFNAYEKICKSFTPPLSFYKKVPGKKDKIHFMGNPSKKGIANSAGLMVNYKYQMDNLEKNHEQYFSREVIASSKSLLSKFNKVKKS